MTVVLALELVAVGFTAGLVGVLTSLASLISYPALLALGLSPVVANVTNTMALLCNGIGVAAGSRAELAGRGAVVARLGAVAAAGGTVGAVLLLVAPAATFHRVVPFLIGGASLFLLAQPYLARRRDGSGGPDGRMSWVLRVALLAAAVYAGYFGAASAVMIFAILTAMFPAWTAQQANAVKSIVNMCGNATAAVGFAFFGPVHWSFVAPLALGYLLGGRVGPVVARRLPGTALRVLAAGCGLVMAVKLAL
ncbi:sulfite exporter TauE/SafE family protein [Nocardia sp. alder85J]|uniref:sulfite exporter TauE/SafE family protein n=1 Tax=Nocardia sp. alder85J TaxID=2862949 RepID=UPI001CD577B0|nr:sulfite exporter TauE/SafE family protein [Nocardia sp. alder85J]MCX4091494.1 sulfite exporter TauE/SafE family protein [Nocardia sp. alder85J]